MKKDITTEEKIKEAARNVFLAKGFEGCSSREIAKAAGMNVALVNYYFRSKSALFQLIFKAAMEEFMLTMVEVFATEKTLEEKLRIFIEKEYEFLAKHPELPNFIINEMNRKDSCFADHNNHFNKIAATGVFNEYMKAQEAGEIRKMDIVSLTLLIMSNCQYPVIAKNLLQSLHSMSDEQYAEQLLTHKRYVTDMLTGYLFLKK